MQERHLLRRRRRRAACVSSTSMSARLGRLAAVLVGRFEAAQRVAIAGQLLQDLAARPLDALEIVQPLVVEPGQLAQQVELLDLLLGRPQLLAQRLGHLGLVALALRQLGQRAINRRVLRLELERVVPQRARARQVVPLAMHLPEPLQDLGARVLVARRLELALERRGHRRPALLLLHEPLELAGAPLGDGASASARRQASAAMAMSPSFFSYKIGQLGQPARLIGQRRRFDRLLGDADQRRVVALLRQVLAPVDDRRRGAPDRRPAPPAATPRSARRWPARCQCVATSTRRSAQSRPCSEPSSRSRSSAICAQLLLRRQQLLEPLDDERGVIALVLRLDERRHRLVGVAGVERQLRQLERPPRHRRALTIEAAQLVGPLGVEIGALEPRRRFEVIGIGAERAPQERDLPLDVAARRAPSAQLDEEVRRAAELRLAVARRWGNRARCRAPPAPPCRRRRAAAAGPPPPTAPPPGPSRAACRRACRPSATRISPRLSRLDAVSSSTS